MTEQNEARGLKVNPAVVGGVDVSGIRIDVGDDRNGVLVTSYPALEKRVAVLEKRTAQMGRRMAKKAGKPLHLEVKTIPFTIRVSDQGND